MNREKTTAAFLADCLAHMPEQPDQVQRAVDIAIDGLKRISNGGKWPDDEALAADWAARSAARSAEDWAAWAASWAAADAAYAATRAPYWAAHAHPDPDAERERQATVREKLGLNREGAK